MVQSCILLITNLHEWSAGTSLGFKIGLRDELLQRLQNVVAQILTTADIPFLIFSSSQYGNRPPLLSREG